MLKIGLFTLLLAGLIWLVSQSDVTHLIHPSKWIMLGFFFTLSVTAHRVITEGMKRNDGVFVAPYFTTFTVRLLLYVSFVGFFIYRHTPNIKIFIVNFFILYLLYTGFEIYTLLTNLRRNSKTEANPRRYDSPPLL